MFFIFNDNGKETHVQITIAPIPAVEAMTISRNAKDFVEGKLDRRQFIINVLSYASVDIEGVGHLQLDNPAIINKYCGDWQNLDTLFNHILELNDISLPKSQKQIDPFMMAGAAMAPIFVAECAKLFGPALQMIEAHSREGE